MNLLAPIHALWITVTLGASLVSCGAETAPLGSPTYVPTPEHPMGWRGDGTGHFSGATPPTQWSRRIAQGGIANAKCQSRKPKGEGDSPDAARLDLGIMKDWLVLGPFATENPVGDIEKPFLPNEAEVMPDENDKVGALSWKTLHTSIDTQSTHYTNEGTCREYNIDFVFLYGKINGQIAYAHTYLYSPTGGKANLAIHRAGVAGKIWLNGQPTTLNPKDYDNTCKAAVTLNKGWNRLLVKLGCEQSTRPVGQNPWISRWLFSAHISPVLPATYETENIAWMTRLPGFSASSPVIVGDRIFATCGTSDLVCIDKKDGKVLWLNTSTPCDAASDAEKSAAGFKEKCEPLAADLKQQDETLVKELNTLNSLQGLPADKQTKISAMLKQKKETEKKLHDALKSVDPKKYVPLYINEVSGTNGTPCTDGKRVYMAAGGGSKGPGAYVFAAYSLDGKLEWSYHEALGAAEHGNHVSPWVLEGKFIYGVMGTLIALDSATGKVVWKTQLPKDAKHYWDPQNLYSCTFIPANISGTSVLISAPGRIVRVSDGQVLSKENNESFFLGQASPLIANGYLYSESGKDFQASQLPPAPESGLKLNWKLEKAQWRKEDSSGSSIASGIAIGGLFYSIDTMGAMTTIDLATQKVLSINRLEMFQRADRMVFGFTASLTLGGKNLYIFDNTGCGLVADPAQQLKPISKNIIENQLASEWQDYKQELFYASPVPDGNSLYVKGSEYLYCIREK